MPARFPFSTGHAPASTLLPANACDCHIHIYDQRVPAVPGARLQPPDASLADYRAIQARMGTQRTVVVTPSTYGTDNRLMLAALDALGPHGRGVAVIDGQEPPAGLHDLHTRGVRGARINLSHGVTHEASAVAHLADRIAPRGSRSRGLGQRLASRHGFSRTPAHAR